MKRGNSIGRGLNIVPQAGAGLVATRATLSKLIAFAYAGQDFVFRHVVGPVAWSDPPVLARIESMLPRKS